MWRLMVLMVLLFGCTQDDSSTTAAKRAVQTAVGADWKQGIDIVNLADAFQKCQLKPFTECVEVERRGQSVTSALASCQNNDARLCNAVRNSAKKYADDFAKLPQGATIALPKTPFYWHIGNDLLDVQAENFDFRHERWLIWWNSNHYMLMLIFGTIIGAMAWESYLYLQKRLAIAAEEKVWLETETQLQEARANRLKKQDDLLLAQLKMDAARSLNICDEEDRK